MNRDQLFSEIDVGSLLDQSTSSIVITDAEGRIVYVNSMFVKRTGYSESECIGNTPAILNSGKQSKAFYTQLWETITSGNPWYGEFLNKTKSGELYWEEAYIFPLQRNGKIRFYIGVKQDISQLKEYGRNYADLVNILDIVPVKALIVSKSERTILYTNHQALRTFGITFKKNKDGSRLSLETSGNDLLSEISQNLDRIESTTDSDRISFQNRSKTNGKTYSLQINIQDIDYQGTAAYLIIATNVSVLKEKENLLNQQKQKLEQYLDVASEIILVLNLDGTINQINKSGYELLEYEEGELEGKNWIDTCIPEDSRADIGAVFSNSMKGERGFVKWHQNKVLTKSGSLRIINWNNALLKDENGNTQGVLSSGQDVTDQERALEQYRQLAQIVENSDDMMNLISSDYTYLAVNKAYAEAFQKEPDELIGERVPDTIGEQAYSKVKEKIDECLLGKSVIFELFYDFPAQKGRYVQVHYSPYRDQNNEIVGVVSILRDLTDKKRAEEEKELLEKQLRQSQKLEAVGRMAGGIAHEFNNILQIQSLYSGIVKNQLPDDADLLENYLHIVDAGERAKDLVKQILTFSRTAVLELRPLKLQFLIKEVLKMVKSTIPAGIQVLEDIDSSCPAVSCDPTMMQQVILNLCNNAVDAMSVDGQHLGTLSLKYHLSPNDSDNSVELVIQDTGQGIGEKILPHIFDPFFSTKPVNKGSGLGLSVAHGIIKDLGGKIEVQSELGVGSTFVIRIPYEKSEHSVQEQNVGAAENLSNSCILFLDDDELIADAARMILEREGFRVRVYSSSLEALENVKESHESIDLIITDLTMPEMSGLVFAEEVRKVSASLPMILTTGNLEPDVEDKVKDLKIERVLKKPWSTEDLMEMISKALHTNH